ncbi:MAG: trimeric intracellular cation channel family protein [Culicoidibacterales bacterium]
MVWSVFAVIGTIAFSLSGAVVAMEEEYDIFGVFILGFVTAFGGGALRNLLIGYPAQLIWLQTPLFITASIAIAILYAFPKILHYWPKVEDIFDAVGLAAFVVQGGMIAVHIEAQPVAIVMASLFTGIGGGIVRDLLARRQPLIFRSEVYAIWAILGGMILLIPPVQEQFWLQILLWLTLLICRLIAIQKNWHLPRRKWQEIAPK